MSVDIEHGAACHEVRDTGIGIDAAFLPHLFDPFSQQDSSPTREYRGVGLGLSIAHELVSSHGGRVVATSDGAQRGARFVVYLPLQRDHTWLVPLSDGPDSAAVSHDAPTALFSELRTLLVDSTPERVELMRELIAQLGAQATVCTSGDRAVRAADVVSPELLITSINMPEMDGLVLLRRLREKVPTIPAIGVIEPGEEAQRDEILAAGFQLVLVQPLDRDALADSVTRALTAAAAI